MSYQWIDILSESNAGALVKCSGCSTQHRIYNFKKTEIFICPKCQKIFSKEHETYNKIVSKQTNSAILILPLLSKCTFNDIDYTVVGCANKHEKGSSAEKWQEYVLIDALGNYAFITLSYGHWTFLKQCNKPDNYSEKEVAAEFENNDGLTYAVYSSYYQITESAIGEFPYDVIDVKKRFSREYVCAPYILTYEHFNSEKTYFQGKYVTPSELKKSFPDNELALPSREGIGSCQPFYLKINYREFLKLSLLFFALSVIPYLFISSSNYTVPLSTNKIILVDSVKTESVVSKSFTLYEPNPSLLRIETHSSIDNDWIEADVTLVNEKTGEEKTFVSGLEYYHGYEDGESWSEGGTEKTDYLNGIKPGKYHAEIKVFGSDKSTYRDIQIQISKDYPTSWNYWILMAALGGITAIIVYLGNRFEKSRFGTLDDE